MKRFLVMFRCNDRSIETSLMVDAISFVACRQSHLVAEMVSEGCREYIDSLLIVNLDSGDWKEFEL